MGLSVYDNLFSGSVPANLTSLAWVSLAYNPLLVGALPAGFNSSKLYAWSAYLNGFYSWQFVNGGSGRIAYGAAPSYNDPGYGTGFLYATSIGLQRPLASILQDVKLALDPTRAALSSWNISSMNPCRPWSSYGNSPKQNSASPSAGTSWRYISTLGVAGSAEYCQDWQAAGTGRYVYTSPTTLAVNTAPTGGIAALWLSGLGLRGTVPLQLRELRTATSIVLSRNMLIGTMPQCWGVAIAWQYFSPSPGFDSCTVIDLGQNRLNGTLPVDAGAMGSQLGLGIYDNLFAGTVPAAYASLSWIAIAYNAQLFGPLPQLINTTKLRAWSGYLNTFGAWSAGNVLNVYGMAPVYSSGYLYGTSIGLPRPLRDILLDIKSALDPNGTVLASWNTSNGLQPCRPWVTNNGAYPGQSAASPGYGRSWMFVSTPAGGKSADFCQDVGSYPYVSASPFITVRNLQLAGGVSALWLPGLGLNGSMPCALGDLQTASSISLAQNALRGYLPPSLVSLSALTAINLGYNKLQGSLPAAFGACVPVADCGVRRGACVPVPHADAPVSTHQSEHVFALHLHREQQRVVVQHVRAGRQRDRACDDEHDES